MQATDAADRATAASCLFANATLAYDALPEDVRQGVDKLKGFPLTAAG